MTGFPGPPPPLFGQTPPPGIWQEHKTPEGRAYYYNSVTKITQWTKPEEMMTAAEVRSINHFQSGCAAQLILE
jgi:pre-mRNA-processing factor 40